MSKRANGEGSIFKRKDGSRSGAITYNDTAGARKRRTVYGRTQAEVRAKLKDARERVEAGQPVKDSALSVGQWLDTWVSTSLAASDRKQATKDLYATVVRKHLVPGLGTVGLGRLKATDVEAFIADRRAQGLSSSTVRTIYTVLRSAFDIAVRDGLVKANVVAAVQRPAVERREAAYLTAAQAKGLLAALHGDRLDPLVRVMLLTGLRRGEALGLHWADVDLDAGQLRVRWTLSRTSRGLELGQPKTAASRRTIPLPAGAVEAFKAQRLQQAKDKLAAGTSWTDAGLVFTTEVGTLLEPRNVLRRFDAVARKAGLPGVGLHTLRHTTATFLLAAGVHMKVVQVIAGHSSYSITADIYSHVEPARAREAADQLDAALTW